MRKAISDAALMDEALQEHAERNRQGRGPRLRRNGWTKVVLKPGK